MAKNNKDVQAEAAEQQDPFEMSPEVIRMADGCFDRADEAAQRNNYDYAIALYIEGLRYNPNATDRGHKALMETAHHRKQAGKKGGWSAKKARMKAGMLQTMGKKKEGFLKLEEAMSADPDNHVDLAQLAQMAQSLGWNDAAVFFTDKAMEAARNKGKMSESIAVQAANIYETNERFRDAMLSLQEAEKLDKSGTGKHMKRIRDLAARTSIGDSGFDKAESFRDVIKDEKTAAASERQRVLTAEEELVEEAKQREADLEQNPDDINSMITIGDTYARAGHDEDALKWYRKARTTAGGGDYRIKVKMDDLRIRQMRQKIREVAQKLRENPDDEQFKAQHQELLDKQNEMELEIYAERSSEYPTEMGYRFELGLRQYRADQIDEAIGSFQTSARDPKRKIVSLNMLGKCFFQRKLFQEAAAQFRTAIEAHELEGDPTWKELRYNLALTYEAMKNYDEAAERYSEIVMADYNYRDAAKRLQEIREKTEQQ